MHKPFSFGFLFLDEIHHVNHFISLAVALSEEHQVSILTHDRDTQYLEAALNRFKNHKVVVEKCPTHWFRKLTDIIKGRPLPRKGFWIKHNRKHLLNDFDALIFTDYIHKKLLKYRGESEFPKFIKIPHGPAGRSYVYKKELKDFDLHIVFGSHYKKNLKARDLLGNKTKVAGYFKLDGIKDQQLPTLFNNRKPVVLYNPHFDERLSSWHILGTQILDYFKSQDHYNLIFAPHINLFNKADVKLDANLLNDYQGLKHIHIDLGSTASVDMVYTRLADIYLGDVSSQSLEFIIQPRPCIFINAHQVDYKGDVGYKFWTFGDVISQVDQLENALKVAPEQFKTYKSIQKASTKGDFKTKRKSTPTERGARKILRFMRKVSS